MYANAAIHFTDPFHNSTSRYSSSQSPYAAYTHLNRPPTPPPEMYGSFYNESAGHERNHDTTSYHKQAEHSQDANAGASRHSISFETMDQKSQDAIAPSFQIPKTVNDSGGSLSELAAEITCLFWFESSELLQQIEDSLLPLPPMKDLAKNAIPQVGFKKFVTTILSTTLVGANVVILALLFIHRLKKLNPSVKGKAGSEYRLLTVALMLGNKFLDDNTYTNKTWAEVSGINVSEVHIMEVEFLSNMKYNLYTSAEEWRRWQALLGRYASYFERAQLPLSQRMRGPAPILPPNSVLRMPMPVALPSPPSSTQASPPYAADLNGSFSHGLTPAQSPLVLAPVMNSRKRSLDDASVEPPAKRLAAYPLDTARVYAQLPMPARAMGMVYPVSAATAVPMYTANSTPTQARFQSAYPANIETPISALLPPRTAHDLSPSVYLHQRSSPYRPVHNVSTLTHPPPSAALQSRQHHVEPLQMRYQPLGKQPQLYTGQLPHIVADAWNKAQQYAPQPRLTRPAAQ